MDGELSIGELADISGMTVQRLRYYSNRGLIKPVRIDTQSNYRYYHMDQKDIILLIQSLQYIGYSLDEIDQLINPKDSSSVSTEHMAEHVLNYINEQEDRLDRVKKIAQVMLHQQIKDERPHKKQKKVGFHIIEYPGISGEFFIDNLEAFKYFKEFVMSKQLSLSYLTFCGVCKHPQGYSYYLEIPNYYEKLQVKWNSYDDFEEFIINAEELAHLLNDEYKYLIMKIPHVQGELEAYRILKAKKEE